MDRMETMEAMETNVRYWSVLFGTTATLIALLVWSPLIVTERHGVLMLASVVFGSLLACLIPLSTVATDAKLL